MSPYFFENHFLNWEIYKVPVQVWMELIPKSFGGREHIVLIQKISLGFCQPFIPEHNQIPFQFAQDMEVITS